MGKRRTWSGLATAAAAAVAVSTAWAGPAHAQEGTILDAGTPGSVADSYLVVLKQDATSRA